MRVKAWVETNKVRSRCELELEFDDEEWEDMDDADRDEVIRDALFDHSLVTWDYETLG